MSLRDIHQPWMPGRLTYRGLNVLLMHLPMGSAYRTWVRDNITLPAENASPHGDPDFEGQRWELINYQLEKVCDTLAAVFGGDDFKPSPVPKMRHEQPAAENDDDEPVTPMSDDEKRMMLEQFRRNRGIGS